MMISSLALVVGMGIGDINCYMEKDHLQDQEKLVQHQRVFPGIGGKYCKMKGALNLYKQR